MERRVALAGLSELIGSRIISVSTGRLNGRLCVAANKRRRQMEVSYRALRDLTDGCAWLQTSDGGRWK